MFSSPLLLRMLKRVDAGKKRLVAQIIELAEHDALDLVRSRQAEQEVLDIIDARQAG